MYRPGYGYAGQVLRVDLSTGAVECQPLDDALVEEFIGGRGFSSSVLWREAGPRLDPLSPDNPLVFATGPLTGIAMASGRLLVAAKSPLTGLIGFSNAGGHWSPELKRAGYDYIVIAGAAEKPVYLFIDDDIVEIRDARALWGRDSRETDQAIKDEIGDQDVQVASIGQAGENQVKIAGVLIGVDHVAARTGMGCVMGAKMLKAVAVRGTKDLRAADMDGLLEAEEDLWQHFRADKTSRELAPKLGTTMLCRPTNERGGLGTRNFQTGYFETGDNISGETIRATRLVKGRSCNLCPLSCDRFCVVKEGEFAGTWVYGPEYATQQNQGSRLGNDNLDALLKANELCNRYGLDTYSTGGVMGFAFELYELGILTQEDTDGLELTWGNYHAQLELIRKIAFREGFGNVLADGVVSAARRIGKGSEYYAMHIKGLDYPSKDPRAYKDYGLCVAISMRGADHLYALSNVRNIQPEEAKRLFGTEKASDPRLPDGKGRVVKWYEEGMTLADMVGGCKLAIHTYASDATEIAYRRSVAIPKLYRAVTGRKVSYEELVRCTERLCTLEKAYNMREKWIGRADDRVPQRFVVEPMPSGPCQGGLYEQDDLLDQYYEAKGWDKATGQPSRAALESLGLSAVADELSQYGRLPVVAPAPAPEV